MLLFLLSAIAVTGQGAQAKPIDPGTWLAPSDFPVKAMRKDIEGAVAYRLQVDTAGRVASCAVTESSGQSLLDKATCNLLLERARFLPPTDAGGRPIASFYDGRIRWTLPHPVPITIMTPGWRGSPRFGGRPAFRLPQPPPVEQVPLPVLDPAATRPPVDPRLLTGQLPNGLRYAILANNVPYGAVSFRLRIGVGSADEAATQAGYAHLVEHMIFRGSTNVPDGEFERSLQQMGLTMGSDTTAFTYPEETVFGLDFPATRLSSTTTGMFLLREVASRALISSGPLVAERGVVLSERRLRDTASLRMENARLAFLLPDQAVARPTVGTLATIANAGADGLRAFYRDHYRPDRSFLVVVGNVVPADIEADIKGRFGDWQAVSPASPQLAHIPLRSRGPAVKLFAEAGGPKYVRIDWQAPYDARPDDYARRADYMADAIAFEILNNRFIRLADKPDTPFSVAIAGEEALFHVAKDTSLFIQPLDGKLRSAINAALTEQRRLVRYGVSQAELERALVRLRAAATADVASEDTRGSPDLANALLASFDNGSIFATPRQMAADIDRLTSHLTVADINAAAARLFAGSGPLLFVADSTPPPGGEMGLRTALAAAASAPVARAPAATTSNWPYTQFGEPGRIVDRKEIADLGVTVVRFANGTTATIKPAPGSGQMFLDIAFGSGLSGLPAGLEHAYWLASLTPQAFALGGLGKASVGDINDQLNGKLVGASLSASIDRFNLAGRTRPEDFEAEAQLLTAYVVDPAFRPRAFRDALSGEASLRTQLDASVPLTAARDLPFLLHDRDPRWRGAPSASDLRATTAGDLPALLRPALAGPLNFVIVGDVDLERAIRVAQATVGALPLRGPRPPLRGARFPAPSPDPVVETVPGAAADKAMAIAAWPAAGFTANSADSRAIQVLAEVIKARLTAGLRERDGLTYAPEVFVDQAVSQPDYSAIVAEVELPPAKADFFYSQLDAIIRDLVQTPIKADELGRARTPMVDASRRAFGFNDYWIDALAGSDSDPRYFDMIRTKIPDLERVSPSDLQRMAARWLDGRAPFRFLVKPADSLSPPDAAVRAKAAATYQQKPAGSAAARGAHRR